MARYGSIDKFVHRGFISLFVMGASPIVTETMSPWLGWPMAVAGFSLFLSAWVGIARAQ